MSDSLDYWDDPRHFKDGEECNDPVCPAVKDGTPHTTDETHQRVLATLAKIRNAKYPDPIYSNMEIGRVPREGDKPSPFLKPAIEAAAKGGDENKPHGTHWIWFFALALFVLAPLEGYAVYLILR